MRKERAIGTLYCPDLEGIVAAIISISNINPTQGDVAYRGYDICALVKRSVYEEVIFLLLY